MVHPWPVQQNRVLSSPVAADIACHRQISLVSRRKLRLNEEKVCGSVLTASKRRGPTMPRPGAAERTYRAIRGWQVMPMLWRRPLLAFAFMPGGMFAAQELWQTAVFGPVQ